MLPGGGSLPDRRDGPTRPTAGQPRPRGAQGVARVGPQRRPGNELPPGSIIRRRAPSRDVAPLETRALGEIALEVGRVQIDALDHAAPAEAQHYPIVPRPASAPGLPPVSHGPGRARDDEVQRLAEELIARGEG